VGRSDDLSQEVPYSFCLFDIRNIFIDDQLAAIQKCHWMKHDRPELPVLASYPELPRSYLSLLRMSQITQPQIPCLLHLVRIRESMEEPSLAIGNVRKGISKLRDEFTI